MGIQETLADYFDFDEHGTEFGTEVRAGVTTFLTMSYIVVVNPSIMTDQPATDFVDGIAIQGLSAGQIEQKLAVITILAAFIATLIMALYANRPFAQAPGLGLNAFFAFTVVGALGVPWQTALAAVVVEGIIFVLLTVAGVRRYVIEAFPEPVKFAVGAGIGAFLAIIGLEAMGVVVNDPATYITLGAVASDPVAILSVLGLFFTFALYARGVRGSIIIGILTTTLVGMAVTFAGLVEPGVVASPAIQQGSVDSSALASPDYDIRPLAGAFVSGLVGDPGANIDALAFALIVFTFFFVDFFDTAGTLTGVGQAAGFLDQNGDLPEIEKPLLSDGIGTTLGGILGTSTVTTYIESATGVEEGGRTGMTALVVAGLFLASLALVPLAAIIPLYASHIALVVVAVIMLGNLTDIQWDDVTHAAPAGMTVLIMPFTYNIGYGIAAGIITYPVVKAATGDFNEIRPLQVLLAALFVVYFVVRTGGVLSGVAG
jgi:AGZA family xanthine/uracil permease-like MFS transporter